MDLKNIVTIVILRLIDEKLKRGMTIIVLFLPYLSYIERRLIQKVEFRN